MKRFTVDLALDNSMFDLEPRQAVSTVLDLISHQIGTGMADPNTSNVVRDFNGNRIGSFTLTLED